MTTGYRGALSLGLDPISTDSEPHILVLLPLNPEALEQTLRAARPQVSQLLTPTCIQSLKWSGLY